MKEEYVNRVVEGKSVIYDQIMLNVVSVYAPHVAFQFEMQMEGKIMEIHVVNIHFKRQEEHCVSGVEEGAPTWTVLYVMHKVQFESNGSLPCDVRGEYS